MAAEFDSKLFSYVVNELAMEGELELDWAMALKSRLNRAQAAPPAALAEMVESFLPLLHSKKVFERVEIYRQVAAGTTLGKKFSATEKAVMLE